jgi:hypothetical protein
MTLTAIAHVAYTLTKHSERLEKKVKCIKSERNEKEKEKVKSDGKEL